MVRLDERMRIGSRMRDRLGLACATAAVACLASFMLQWSTELPVQPSSWEQNLFGDLAAPGPPLVQAGSNEEATASDQAGPSPDALEDRRRNEPILVEVMPNLMEPTHATALERRSDRSHARFIQPVRHQQAGHPPTVWLSGAIELLTDDPEPAGQPGTRYFPEAHRD